MRKTAVATESYLGKVVKVVQLIYPATPRAVVTLNFISHVIISLAVVEHSFEQLQWEM